jgi:hypothetical protein
MAMDRSLETGLGRERTERAKMISRYRREIASKTC